ncbi:MAG: alginate export family protein [Gammaproteobacteria bacterium]|jgi:hypothetical protein|nr:alginate export family protein [Gammaproteobacteria bacterium]MDP6617093.1 alginate export family protein [Gammaproteobacteria bacterium]
MRKDSHKILPTLFFSLTAFNTGFANSFTDSISKAFDDDLISLSLRYRYETVDDDAKTRDATASTLKTSFTIAPKGDNWSFLAQIDNVTHIGNDRFSDTRNGKTMYPTVVDPDGTHVNQGYVSYSGFEDTTVAVGRQRITRSNQRFVGGVIWRQNEQTYDAASVSYDNDKLDLYYSFIGNVERLYGPDSGTPLDNLESDTHLLDAQYTISPTLKIFGYGYFMDFEDDAPTFSNQTIGVRVTGKAGSEDGVNMDYQIEVASQDDYADNPVDYDASYYLLDATVNVSDLGFRAGYEVLEGDDSAGKAFRTPLATLHKFQGWADKFLTTPDAGIEDAYIGATAKFLGAKFSLIYHDFSSEAGSTDWGDEIDFSALWKIGKNYSVLLKAAKFDADSEGGMTDATKVWLQLQASW